LSYCLRKGKPADESDGPSLSKKVKSSKEDAEIKDQSKLMYKYRDQLKKHLKKKDLQYLLEYNEQDVPSGEDRVRVPFSCCDMVQRFVRILGMCVATCRFVPDLFSSMPVSDPLE
jgi:hypothetical protein